MALQKKLIIIGILSILFSIVSFFVVGGERNPNIFMNVFEIGMLAVLAFFLFAINFFALAFCIKKIAGFLKKRNQ